MKRIFALVLVLVLLTLLAACGKVEITMQEIYDAGLNEVLLRNHESISVRNEMDGEVYSESYQTQDYIYYNYVGLDWVEFLTEDVYYDYFEGDYACVFPVSPDGVVDVASYRAKYYTTPFFAEDTVYETIESVSKKDGRIIVKTFFDQYALENHVEDETLIDGHFEYVLDAKTREIISFSGDSCYDDGEAYHMVFEVRYDTEAPEMVKTFLEYASQTEDLRNVTVITNPGTEKEVSQSFQVPRGLFVGFSAMGSHEETYELYVDAACTEIYEFYGDADSDLTIYVKWDE